MRHHTRFAAAALLLACGLAISPILDSGHSADILDSGRVPSAPPRFEISWLRGQLQLAGHTASRQHENDLLQVAAGSYPEHAISSTFELLRLVPDDWAANSIQTLYALAETLSAHAVLSANELVIRGVAGDRSGWPIRLEALRRSLPADIAVRTNVLLVADTFRLADSCSRVVAQFAPGPINFDKSSTKFRSSAYAVLDRTVAIARACRESTISITGHTDSSGDESWNERLSLERANTVATYIERGGIAATRLIVAGAGSSEPIAENDTSYGRSLNRRIEVVLGDAQH